MKSSYILEDELGGLIKIIPDNFGNYDLFKRYGSDWSWDDSIGKDSVEAHILSAPFVYRLQKHIGGLE